MACFLLAANAWLLPPARTLSAQRQLSASRVRPCMQRQPTAGEDVPPVDKATFVAAVEILDRELAKAGGVDPPKSLSEAEGSGEAAFAIGKTTAKLPLSEVEGLGLVEAAYLVLVSGVTTPLVESGLQVKDTIVSVSVEGTELHESTRALDLAATAERLTAAIKTAEENGVAEIGLELNRLVELRYAEK